MIFSETPIPGVFEIGAQPHSDARGIFARLYCPEEFAHAGIAFTSTQVNLSTNLRRHTLRGLHFQSPPHAEAKLVRCIAGTVWDVAVDLRPGPGQGRWHAVELDAERMNAVFLPDGIAHGFLTLTDGAQVLYQMGRLHEPGHGRGIRWDDPDLAIAWPGDPEVISDADRAWPGFCEAIHGG
jgi:dTDP-4-dehydrorhamnose 3,5-epimerase